MSQFSIVSRNTPAITEGRASDLLSDERGRLLTNTSMERRFRDVVGRMKVAIHQNIYEADFEYGKQPLRWEEIALGSATITHQPGLGGVRMRLTTTPGDVTIRQSRPYHRYQPGKTMFMATAVNFGAAQINQNQRVGFFDDSNGLFFEQSVATATNPFGVYVVYRQDSNNLPTDTRVDFVNWLDPQRVKDQIDWSRIQMLFLEYAWYGAGLLRWGVYLQGEPFILHEIGAGNLPGQVNAWARTGNLPVRYEQRNAANPPSITSIVSSGGTIGIITFSAVHNLQTGNQITIAGATPSGWNGTYTVTVTSPTTVTIINSTPTATVVGSATAVAPPALNDMVHYGVSVLVEGTVDDQRGFTYPYGMALGNPTRTVAAASTRFPLLSFRMRTMGTIEAANAAIPGVPGIVTSAATAGTTTTMTATGTPWTVNQWVGRSLFFPTAPMPSISSGTVSGQTGSITFASAHGLQTGSFVTITGATPSGWNGTWGVTRTGANTVDITFPTGAAPANYTSGATVTTPITARITANTTSQLTFVDVVTGGAALTTAVGSGVAYQIGLINRGQVLPNRLIVSSSAIAQLEVISSTPNNPVSLVGASFAAMNTLGSQQSLVERDVSATAMSGGEVVMRVTLPAGGSGLQDINLSTLFPLYNTVRGNQPDILTLAVSTPSGGSSNVGADFIGQEAMS